MTRAVYFNALYSYILEHEYSYWQCCRAGAPPPGAKHFWPLIERLRHMKKTNSYPRVGAGVEGILKERS